MYCLKIAEDLTLPPRSSCSIDTQVQTKSTNTSNHQGFVTGESTDNIHTSSGIANLYDLQEKRTPLIATNTSDHPVTIQANPTIARFEILTDDDVSITNFSDRRKLLSLPVQRIST